MRCASYHWGETSPTHLLNLCTLQAFVVAGGRDGSDNYLSSVLTLLPGAEIWTPLASLPRRFDSARASIMEGRLRVTGGGRGGEGGRWKVEGRSEVCVCPFLAPFFFLRTLLKIGLKHR